MYLIRGVNGKTYIGYSRDPERRLQQHNGILQGGAAPVSGRPWKLLMDISGFRSSEEALSFEYAWQFPHVRFAHASLAHFSGRTFTFVFCLCRRQGTRPA